VSERDAAVSESEGGALFVDHAGVLGGAELSLLDLAAAFGARCEVLLLADGPFRTALESRGVRVSVESLGALKDVKKETRFPRPAAFTDAVRIARHVARRAKRHRLIYANSQKAFVVAAAAGLLSRRPVVWHLRDILAPPHFSGTNVRAAVTLANLRAARVITNSRATALAFTDAGGHASLVRVVHNGIDPAPFDAVTAGGAAATRAALGVPPDAFVVSLFGRFHPWKGQQVLLDALTRLPRVHALFVGAPLFGEDAFASALQAQAAKTGVAGRAHFLGFRTDVAELMRASDAVVHASVYPEPFGRVIVEGMLAGRPVIATRAGGVTEIVDDETGVLVPPNDSEALAAAIDWLAADPVRAAQLAARGAARARSEFTVTAMVSGVEEALRGLP
jgi:glycosyltransferase involved in cell wall biosynthesis